MTYISSVGQAFDPCVHFCFGNNSGLRARPSGGVDEIAVHGPAVAVRERDDAVFAGHDLDRMDRDRTAEVGGRLPRRYRGFGLRRIEALGGLVEVYFKNLHGAP